MSNYSALLENEHHQSINISDLGSTALPVAHASAPSSSAAGGDHYSSHFTAVIGSPPWQEPNVRPRADDASHDLYRYLNKENEVNGCVKALLRTLCCATGLGGLYLLGKQVLVSEGQWGFAMNNGQPEILLPGRHLLSSPLNSLVSVRSSGDDVIEVGPISIIRVPEGCLGFAMNNALPEILLPGRHVRKDASFKFSASYPLSQELCVFGPIKIFIVMSGTVRVCYHGGRVQIFKEGRYLVNSGTFQVAGVIPTVQQNVRFSKHPVLLDGGISMLVEGLLTYQVVDVVKLITELGDRDLLRAITDVTKAELARVFSSIHLEQISASNSISNPKAEGADRDPEHLLGKQDGVRGEGAATARTLICDEVVRAIAPFAALWGVKIINFQLESTKIADQKYAMEYEEASLGLAKAKANRRAIDAQNEIMLQKAAATANASKIEAEGRKQARILDAQGEAEAMRIQAQGRNDAATTMTDEFSRKLQLSQQQVEFAASLKATSVTVLPDSAIGRPFVKNLGS